MFGAGELGAISSFESETKSSSSMIREVARIELEPASIGAVETAERQTRGVDLVAPINR